MAMPECHRSATSDPSFTHSVPSYLRNLLLSVLCFTVGTGMPASLAATSMDAVPSAAPDPTSTPSPGPTSTPWASPSPSPSPTAPARSSVTSIRLPTTDRGRTARTVVVYRPAVADSAGLPVLYLLHGQYGTPGAIVSSTLQEQLDRLFAAGVAPFVVAAPDGASATRSDDEWGDAADGADRLETFLQQQVIPAVEGDHLRNRAHRAVAGFSMGGYAAAFTAGLRSSTYGQVVSLAGYFHVDDPQHVFADPAVRDLHYPLHHLRWLNGSRVLLLDCTDERDGVVAGEAQRMHDALARIGRPPGLRFTAGQHDGAWLSRQWPAVARFLAEGWGR
jgi:enterochelin esterase-like enzyme